ncbi:helix-turn-helix domain-containing protein [Aureliella helgolandensis]|uniref:Helix-turn-helix protein n=1 Tax=Aureliella helgolandensis TaxID=2527968 RepID=A0A518G4B6_9BACT|nr:helix-turn-helix transcriptional regulator [Aureliella helgolandensis]QDV23443.1 helix-turn-helix protein [Aureliella helgolandensis]
MQTKFGLALREARRRGKDNLLKLAEAAGVSVAYVSQVERGTKNPPNETTIRKWLQALKCEDRLEEFLLLAAQSVRHLNVSTKGKSSTSTNVLASLARSYEQDEIPDDVWEQVERFIATKRNERKDE